MAYAGTVPASPDIRLPRAAIPRFRLPHLSQRTRALLMMGLMISPAFLCDSIGYCVERLFMTAEQIEAKQVPDSEVLSQLRIFHVACTQQSMPTDERQLWAELAARYGWPSYPEGGPTCFKPDRNLYGIAGLTAFNVACPAMVLSVADQRRWVGFAANHGWTEYPQAGLGCVDP